MEIQAILLLALSAVVHSGWNLLAKKSLDKQVFLWLALVGTLVIFFVITIVYLPAFVVLGLWFVLQAFSGLLVLSNHVNAGGGVAFWAHIGGFSFGAVMALLFFPRERFGDRPPPSRPDWRGRRWPRRRPQLGY